jgi:hypothetical protein
MRNKRNKLEKNPNSLQPLRYTNLVVRIARTTKRTEVVKEPSKNRSEKMRTPKPMITSRTASRQIKSQKL